MNLSSEQINQLLDIFNHQLVMFAGNTLGSSYLSHSEKKILQDSGIDIESLYDHYKDPVELNFQLGLLTKIIGSQANTITFEQLRKFIANGNYIPLNEREKATINSIKHQALSDIRANQGKIFQDINNVVHGEGLYNRSHQEEVVRTTVIEGIANRESIKRISVNLARLTGDWNRNFYKSVQYISHTALNEGRLALIQRRNQGQVKVYFQVQKDACKYCVELYLTKGQGSEPKIFGVKELLANGTNIGRKVDELKPVIGPVHPHCRCLLTEYIEGEKWNGMKFVISKEEIYHPKLERKKVHITFNGQDYYV